MQLYLKILAVLRLVIEKKLVAEVLMVLKRKKSSEHSRWAGNYTDGVICEVSVRIDTKRSKECCERVKELRRSQAVDAVVVVVQNEDDRSERGGIVRKKKGRDGRALLDVKKTGTQLLNRLLSNWEETIILVVAKTLTK